MEFIKMLLEAFGWNVFPLAEERLHHSVAYRKAQSKLGNIRTTRMQGLVHSTSGLFHSLLLPERQN